MSVDACTSVIDFVIVGAGPAGVQWATLLAHAGEYTYTVLEASERAGSFFSVYPRARRLISHNRCNLGSEATDDFSLRHDWHTLLHANESFCARHRRFYPWADEYVDYLSTVAASLNVQYGQEVVNVTYAPEHALTCTRSQCLRSRHVVLATGLSVRPSTYPLHYGNFPALDHREEADFCRGKRVGILGSGNAAFETANMLKTCARSVHVFAHQTTFAALTHYPGHLRLQQGEFLDRYFLKSLDSIVVTNEMQRLTHCAHPSSCFADHVDVVVYCGGFTGMRPPLVTRMSAHSKARFPESNAFYSVPDSEGRGWYAGVLMHEHDYKRSSGGFVHGFRYLVRAQHRYVRALEGKGWEGKETLTSEEAMLRRVVERIQESSGLYQMQGFLVDVVFPLHGGRFAFLPEIPEPWVRTVLDTLQIPWPATRCTVKLEYGTVPGGWQFEAAVSNQYARSDPPVFLHPSFTDANQNVFRAAEDLKGTWRDAYHVHRIRQSMTSCLSTTRR